MKDFVIIKEHGLPMDSLVGTAFPKTMLVVFKQNKPSKEQLVEMMQKHGQLRIVSEEDQDILEKLYHEGKFWSDYIASLSNATPKWFSQQKAAIAEAVSSKNTASKK